MTDQAVDAALRRYHHEGPAPDPADLATIRRRVLARTAEPARPGRRALRTATVAIAAAVVAAGAITFWPAGPREETRPAQAMPGTEAITEAITDADSVPATVKLVVERVANAQPLDLGHGGFLYTAERALSVRTVTGKDGPASYVTEDVTERWSAVGEGTLPKLVRMTHGLNAHPLSPADGAKLAAYGTDYTKVTTVTADPATNPKYAPAAPPEPGLANPTPAYLASLPTDPGRLAAVLRAAVAEDGPGGDADRLLFKRVSALATTADALLPPPLRSALYQVLATVPGVERVPGQVDLAGRAGVAIAHTADGKRTEIVLDPVSSRMLGFRIVAVAAADGMPAGTVVYSATADQKIVEKPGEKK